MATKIYVKASRADLRSRLALLPAILSGRAPDPDGIARGFQLRLAVAFLEKVKQAFITKSRGGTDEAGIKWKKLTKAYLAYQRRFGGSEKAALKKAAGLGSGHRWSPGGKDGLLTKGQEEAWWRVYRQALAWLAKSHDPADIKGMAASVAWNWIKENMGAKTKLEIYGNREVEIGRDTGVLFNSLSPGQITGEGSHVYLSNQPRTQEIHIAPGSLIVGTNVAYAEQFHDLRPLWPENVPEAWLDYFMRQASAGLASAFRQLAGAA